MANVLKQDKQEMVINMLIEGNSIRSTERMTGVHRDTIMRLGVSVGAACEVLHNDMMRNLPCKRLQLDEIWCFVGKKQRHVTKEDDSATVGDAWTFCAIDADTKLIPAFRVGKRTAEVTDAFVDDLRSRLTNRVQISTDGMSAYVDAIEDSFGAAVDFAQIIKVYEADALGAGRYSPPKVVSTEVKVITGRPARGHISTSYVERQNLTMRMQMRRFTRLTNGFSKKWENLCAAVALHFAHYNLCRVHSTLRITPAMAAGVTDHVWSIGELLEAAKAV